MTKRLLIVAHAPSPNTVAMRDAVLEGAQHPDIASITPDVRSPFDTAADDVMAADGIILLTTENLGYMSGAMKDFFDRTYYPVLEEKQGLPCAIVIRAGNDGTGTKRGLDTILTGLRWKQVSDPLICKGEWDDAFLPSCSEIGMTLAAGLEAGVF
ncbi:Multimeric flavodoxin WrbA [Candidatus Phaeomarinobacter ectocarpi]|uniref:Multimeric flavodoxin WrbA n=1 Tax=Candidatus Phaeomarinibacter ectocarpi TaxID=1458461 RepID=X5M6X2_9HYPH|nr:NAD(P)H-dependent oxidoreductase [Candidatus Phaeomarinobacter ectocarpi]CDO58818.1 Multimeric flavodoxin WrbA [Candidatus Phaeomarinobacter ectocarpi]